MSPVVSIPPPNPRINYTYTPPPQSLRSKASSLNPLLQKDIPPLPPVTADPLANRFREHGIFSGLLLITAISGVLLASSIRGWILPVYIQNFVNNNRATASIIVQVISGVFGFLQIAPICAVINRATRLIISKREASLDELRFWSLICARGLDWHLPWKHLLPLLIFLFFTLNPSAIWAGALTPVNVYSFHPDTTMIPSYSDMSLIKEYPSEFGNAADQAQVRNTKGVFSYAVGTTFEGDLLASAASATTIDGSARQHKKLDFSGLTYNGRSFGIGSATGLMDDAFMSNAYITGYAYTEMGYNASVTCIYNSTSNFQIYSSGDNYPLLFQAQGLLPNTPDYPETSQYWGHGEGPSIVAIGVAVTKSAGPKYLAIASGSNYATLNQTQCTITFTPTLYNVTVQKSSNTITVLPISTITNDIDPSGNLSHVSVRQFELISNDQTNLYQSLVGNSIMRSIESYKVAQMNASSPLTQQDATLSGLQNSVTAMLDDMLVGYASAQLMVAKQHAATPATVTVLSMRVGERSYIVAEMVINCLALLIVFLEMVRTRGWKGLGVWDYMDVRNVVVGASRGGRSIADYVDGIGEYRERTWMRGMKSWDSFMGETEVRFVKDEGNLVFAGSVQEKEKEKSGSFAMDAREGRERLMRDRADSTNRLQSSRERSDSVSGIQTIRGWV